MKLNQEMIDTLTPDEAVLLETMIDESNESQVEFEAEMQILEDATHPLYEQVMRKYA